MSAFKFTGLCTATHTPFHADGSMNLAVVEQQAAFLRSHGITSVFIKIDIKEVFSSITMTRVASSSIRSF